MFDISKYISLISRQVADAVNIQEQPYIHCSKINGFIKLLHELAPLLVTAGHKKAVWMAHSHTESITNVLMQFKQIHQQCLFENSSHFALTTPISYVYSQFSEMIKDLKKAFEQLGVTGINSIFDTAEADLKAEEKVDVKRISEIIIQIRDQNQNGRKDVQMHLKKRTQSLEKLGISMNTIVSDLVTIPDLPENLNLVLQQDDLEMGPKIGNGISGSVYKGKIKNTGKVVAIKILHTRQLSNADMQRYRNEVFAMSTLIHPTLLEFCGYTQESPYCLVTKFMENGSLFHTLSKQPDFLTPTDRTLIAYDIARGMEFLHSRGVIHRDLKSLNILLDENKRAKICDFGFVRMKSSVVMTGLIGTSHWMAPEILLSTPDYDEKVDVYSYGILLWELLTSKQPYEGEEQNTLPMKIVKLNLRPKIPDGTPIKIKTLIEKCWNSDPEVRPPFKDIVSYFSDPEYHFPGCERFVLLRETGLTTSHNYRTSHGHTLSDSEHLRKPFIYKQNLQNYAITTIQEKNFPKLGIIRIEEAIKQGHLEAFRNAIDSFKQGFFEYNCDRPEVYDFFKRYLFSNNNNNNTTKSASSNSLALSKGDLEIGSTAQFIRNGIIRLFFETICSRYSNPSVKEILLQILKDNNKDALLMALTMLTLTKNYSLMTNELIQFLIEFRKNGDNRIRAAALTAVLTLSDPKLLVDYLNSLLMFGLRRLPEEKLELLLQVSIQIIKNSKKEELDSKIPAKFETIQQNIPPQMKILINQCIYEYKKKAGEEIKQEFIDKAMKNFSEYRFVFSGIEDYAVQSDPESLKEGVKLLITASNYNTQASSYLAEQCSKNKKIAEVVIHSLPLNVPHDSLGIIYDSFIQDIDAATALPLEEFYKASAIIISGPHYFKVCTLLKNDLSSIEYSSEHGVFKALSQQICLTEDKQKLNEYLSLLFSYLRRSEKDYFSECITKLTNLLREDSHDISPLAFACLCIISKFNKQNVDMTLLTKAATKYAKTMTGAIQALSQLILTQTSQSR